ncbi:glycosyltransferase, partial [Mycobacterium tuberculosis]
MILASFLSGAKPIQHVQDLEIDTALAVGHVRASRHAIRFVHAMEQWIMRRFERVITISSQMRARLIAKGVSPDRVEIVRNWVDTNLVKPLNRCSEYR